jgi:hypothetical protein
LPENDTPEGQSLAEMLRNAGLEENVTLDAPITEGMPDTPEDHQGASGEMPRDPDLSHPEDIDDRFSGCYRLTDLLREWFAESIQRWAQTEQIVWDISLMAMPDPNQQGMFHPGLVIALSIKGAVLNSIIYNTTVQQPFGLTREVVDAWCKAYIGEMLQGRTEQLGEMSKQAEQAMANGRQAPGGGLILPGQ